MKIHPGGVFVMNHNIGRDISKFFHGGYTLINSRGTTPYTHSNIARRICNGLAVAHLGETTSTFKASLVSVDMINKTSATVSMSLPESVKGVSLFYSDLSMIGKHYLLQSVGNHNIKRHYTISNCMHKEAYQEYVRLLSVYLKGEKTQSGLDKYTIERPSGEMVLTIKNYAQARGLSSIIHKGVAELLIQGPMGKGLCI
jgi:hypothetical protein